MKKIIFSGLLMLILLIGLPGCSQSSQQADADPLAGTSWIADNDGSQWVFRDDGSFSWYRDKEVTDDYYYAGNYTAYRGAAAVDYLVDVLPEYASLTYSYSRKWVEELLDEVGRDADYNRDNFICFSCDNKSYMLGGQEQLNGEWITAYYGFIMADETELSIVNLITGSYYRFSREE